jgi:integrase
LFEGTNPVSAVKLTKEPQQRPRVLTPEEETRLLTECTEPLRTQVLLGIYCGIRLKSEGLTLRWQDIDFRLKVLTVQAAYSKNSKPRTIPMNSVVLDALSRLPKKSEWVFTKPNGRPYTAVRGFIEARTAAGLIDVIPDTNKCAVTVHTLRHTFATRLIENGVDLRTVQELGGWSNLKMLERYGHVSPSRKAAAVEGLIPPCILPSEMRHLVTA